MAQFRDLLIHIGQSRDGPEMREKIRRIRRVCIEACRHAVHLLLQQVRRYGKNVVCIKLIYFLGNYFSNAMETIIRTSSPYLGKYIFFLVLSLSNHPSFQSEMTSLLHLPASHNFHLLSSNLIPKVSSTVFLYSSLLPGLDTCCWMIVENISTSLHTPRPGRKGIFIEG